MPPEREKKEIHFSSSKHLSKALFSVNTAKASNTSSASINYSIQLVQISQQATRLGPNVNEMTLECECKERFSLTTNRQLPFRDLVAHQSATNL